MNNQRPPMTHPHGEMGTKDGEWTFLDGSSDRHPIKYSMPCGRFASHAGDRCFRCGYTRRRHLEEIAKLARAELAVIEEELR